MGSNCVLEDLTRSPASPGRDFTLDTVDGAPRHLIFPQVFHAGHCRAAPKAANRSAREISEKM
jgi:hypothetical protein